MATDIFIDPTVFWVTITALPTLFTVISFTSPLSAQGRVVKPSMIAYFVRMVFSPLFATLFWGFDAYYTAVTGTEVVSGNVVGFTIWPIALIFVGFTVIMGIFTFAMMLTEGLAVLRDEDIFEAQATGEARGPYE